MSNGVIELNEPDSDLRRIPFYLVDDTDGKTPETGQTFSASDIQISKNGGTLANSAGTVTEVGGGLYHYIAAAGEVDTEGYLYAKVVKSGVRSFPIMATVKSLIADMIAAHRVGRQIYVAASGGNDTYAGTRRTRPKATIASAISASVAGDTIVLLGGTHTTTADISPTAGTRMVGVGMMQTTISFTATNKGIIVPDGFFLGSLTITDASSGGQTVGLLKKITGASNAFFRDLRLNSINDCVVVFSSSACNWIFENCYATSAVNTIVVGNAAHRLSWRFGEIEAITASSIAITAISFNAGVISLENVKVRTTHTGSSGDSDVIASGGLSGSTTRMEISGGTLSAVASGSGAARVLNATGNVLITTGGTGYDDTLTTKVLLSGGAVLKKLPTSASGSVNVSSIDDGLLTAAKFGANFFTSAKLDSTATDEIANAVAALVGEVDVDAIRDAIFAKVIGRLRDGTDASLLEALNLMYATLLGRITPGTGGTFEVKSPDEADVVATGRYAANTRIVDTTEPSYPNP